MIEPKPAAQGGPPGSMTGRRKPARRHESPTHGAKFPRSTTHST
jgi:hypothetical protein